MKKRPRILLAVDGSDQSMAAVRYVGRVVSKQTDVVLFHVQTDVPESFRDLGVDPLPYRVNDLIEPWTSQQRERMTGFMRAALHLLAAAGFPPEAVSVKIHPLVVGVARDILRESRQDINALVVGRHSSQGKAAMLGSVASKLADAASHLPFAVVGGNAENRKILVAFDGSQGSWQAVACAASLLDQSACEVMLCHVLRPLNMSPPATDQSFVSRHERRWIEANQRRMVPSFSEARSLLMHGGYAAERVSREILTYKASRADAIVEEAETGGYDTVVVGRRGFSAVAEFRMGRVGQKILHRASQSALWIAG